MIDSGVLSLNEAIMAIIDSTIIKSEHDGF